MKQQITLTNKEMINAKAALDVLSRQVMAINPGFMVAQNIKALEGPAELYGKFRKELLEKYVELDKGGEIVTDDAGRVIFTSPADEQAAKVEISEMDAITLTADLRTVSIESLTGVSVQPAIWISLSWMFEDSKEEDAAPPAPVGEHGKKPKRTKHPISADE